MTRPHRRLTGVTVIAVWSLVLVPLALAAVFTEPDLADTVSVSDRITATLTTVFRPAPSDSVSIGDRVVATLRAVFRPVLDEAVSVGDSVTATLKSTLRSRLDDGVAVSDRVSISLRSALRPLLAERVAIGDQLSVSLHAAVRPVLTERISFAEQISAAHLTATTARLADLTDVVNNTALPSGTTTSLLASLSAAQASNATGRMTAACGQLEAFINKVHAQVGKAIPPAAAAELIRVAQRAEATVPCK
jgi:hypothetical protein